MMNYLPGQTPLDPDEITGLLLPVHTKTELDEAETDNIDDALVQLLNSAFTAAALLSENRVKFIHRMMFANVWAWAGHFRRTDKNMGVPWPEIALAYRQLRDDTQYWIDHDVYPTDELAIRYKHRLVSIHPFPNGNGRHSRLLADLLTESLGRPTFTWGTGIDDPRTHYLQALKRADAGDITPLLRFARQ